MVSSRFPAAPRAHRPGCPLAPADAAAMTRGKALDRWVGLFACHCVAMGPDSQPLLIEHVDYPEHAYSPTMLWPGGAARSLCATCHGDHLPDHDPHVRAGTWAPARPDYPTG